jgi:ribosome-associated protein
MNEDNFEFEEDFEPSKSQLKREAKDLVSVGEKLLKIPEQQLHQIELPEVVDAVLEAKKITKGNARKRQLQFIGKLLRKSDTTALVQLLNRFDASSAEHATQFHQLEDWRERLISEDASAMEEITSQFPHTDRQHLRTLTRNAIRERRVLADNPQGKAPVQFRKLFQYLKSLIDS